MIKNINTYLNDKNLKTKIIVFIIMFAIVFISLIFLVMYYTYYNSSVDQIEIASNSLLESFSYKYSIFAEDVRELIYELKNDENMYNALLLLSQNSGDVESYNSVASTIEAYLSKNKRIKSIRIHLKNNEICLERNGHEIIYDNLFNYEYVKNLFKYDNQMISLPSRQIIYQSRIVLNKQNRTIYSYNYNKSMVSFCSLLKENNDDFAMILIDFEENYIANLQRVSNLTKNNFFVLTNSEGDVITSLSKEYVGKNISDVFDSYPYENYFPNRFYVKINGENFFVTHSKNWRYNWDFFSFIPVKEIFKNKNILFNSILILLFFFITLIIILAYILTKTITKPTYKIINALEQLKMGNFSSRIIVERNDEFGKISEMFNFMSDNLQVLIKEKYEIEIKEKEAELKFLQSQINPHFLYNTLETIKWKVLANSENTDVLLTSLGQILRYNFKNPSAVVTLEDELKQLKNYLFIQQTRYEGRFQIYYNFNKNTLNMKIHKFMIQPIVENSIKHGLEHMEKGGKLYISSRIENKNLLITVLDNGCGMEENKISELLELNNQSNNIGCNNVHKRIQYYYGEEYGLEITSKVNYFTRTIIRLPIMK
ncbi:MAG: histidine kinase [Clostridia bacterium]|nr:histidine kinase [Clostridia bacterium]